MKSAQGGRSKDREQQTGRFRGTIRHDSWHNVGGSGEPAFENSWANYGSSYVVARFRKDAGGFVHIQGMVASGSGTVFTLPAGYRPDTKTRFNAQGNSGLGQTDIDTDGTVDYIAGGNTWFLLDCSFYAG